MMTLFSLRIVTRSGQRHSSFWTCCSAVNREILFCFIEISHQIDPSFPGLTSFNTGCCLSPTLYTHGPSAWTGAKMGRKDKAPLCKALINAGAAYVA